MNYYSNEQLTDYSMSRQAGEKCVGYGAGASHERIIQGAGGEIGYDGFKDPRPNQEGNIRADRVFINEKTNEIQGINFSKDGKFCCSYTGSNYADIKDSNRLDCEQKKEKTHSDNVYGISEQEMTAARSEKEKTHHEYGKGR